MQTFSEEQRMEFELQQQVFDNSKGFKTLEAAKASEEKFDIIFDSENQEYKIEVNRNESLVKERELLWKQSQ